MSSRGTLEKEQSFHLSEDTMTALQLSEQPFGQLSASELFNDDTTSEQLADIKHALITGDDLLLVVGPTGAGKSTLLELLNSNSGLRIQCFSVHGTERFSTQNLFAGMLEAFKQPASDKIKDTLDNLIPCLQTMIARNTLCTVVLDDADQVTDSELTQLISCMLYLNSQDETLVRILLSATEEFESRIPDLLPEGSDLPYSSLTIEGMDPHRAAYYLTFKLENAGFMGEWPFTDEQIDQFVEETEGAPGRLEVVAARALNNEYGSEDDYIPDISKQSHASSVLQTRVGKFALGSIASVCILAGLFMFVPSPIKEPNTPTDNSSLTAVDTVDLLQPVEMLNDEATNTAENRTTNTAPTEAGDNADPDSQLASNQLAPEPAATSESTETTETVAEVGASLNFSAEDVLPSTTSDEPASSDGAEEDVVVVAGNSLGRETLTIRQLPPNPNPEASSPEPAAAEPETVPDTPLTAEEETTTAVQVALNNAATQQTPTVVAETTTPSEDENSDPNGVNRLLESPSWILLQDNEKFTVQMSASRDRASVENFLKRNAETLDAPNSIYTFQRDGDTWFALVHGIFDSIGEARQSVERMPDSATSNQPWIRSIGRLQDVLREQ